MEAHILSVDRDLCSLDHLQGAMVHRHFNILAWLASSNSQISIEVILHISVRLLHLQCGSTACLGDSPERSQCHDVSPHCHNWTDCLLLYQWVCVCVCVCVCLSLSLSHSAVTLTMAKNILGVCCTAVVARLAMKICT
jgi:hypothetical protein